MYFPIFPIFLPFVKNFFSVSSRPLYFLEFSFEFLGFPFRHSIPLLFQPLLGSTARKFFFFFIETQILFSGRFIDSVGVSKDIVLKMLNYFMSLFSPSRDQFKGNKWMLNSSNIIFIFVVCVYKNFVPIYILKCSLMNYRRFETCRVLHQDLNEHENVYYTPNF